MPSKLPTTADIVKLVTLQHEEVKDRLAGVEEQVKYTNGRVTKLEGRAGGEDAVRAYIETQEARPGSNPKASWDWKAYLALLATLATIIAGVVSR